MRAEKISLNKEGEISLLIEPDEESNEQDVDNMKITSKLIFLHQPYCDGHLKFIKITDKQNVLSCNNCGLRLPFPNAIKTIKDLRKFLEKK